MKGKSISILVLSALLSLSISSAYSQNNDYSVAYIFEIAPEGDCVDCGDFLIKDTMIMETPGEPLVPYRVAKILIPQEATLKDIKVKYGVPTEQAGFDIAWGQNPLTFSNPNGLMVGKNENAYNSDNWYLGKLFDVISVETYKGFQIALLHLYPVDYKLKSGTVKFYPAMTVELQFGKGMKNKLYRGLADDKADVAAVVDNTDMIATYEDGGTPLPIEDWIVITNSSLVATFQQLATHKALYVNGTGVYDVSWITSNYTGVDNQEKIRNFIKDKYTNNGTKYVLLGGDTGIVPYRGFYISSGGYTDTDMAADMYYGHLDGNWNNDGDSRYAEPGEEDWYAEVAVGRAPVDNTTEAQAFVNKVIAYEQSQKPTRICFHQSRVQSNNNPDSRCLAYNADNYVPGGWTIDYLFEENGTVTKTLWQNAWAAGPIAVFHIGHGNTTVYHINYEVGGTVSWYNSDVPSLTNTFFPWTTSVACISGQFTASDCLSEAYVKDDCGAIGAIYNDNYGWFSTLDACKYSGEFCQMESRAFFSDGKQKLGDMLNQSRSYMASSASSNSTYRWCYYERNLMGDPESPCLTVRDGGQTGTVTITNPSNGATVNGTVTITVSYTGCIDTVEFYIDGTHTYTDTSPSFEWPWDTTQYADGNHTILVKGYCSGELKDDDSITVTVNNGGGEPYVLITYPQDGATISGTVTVTTDTNGVDEVRFYVNNSLKYTDTTAPYTWNWDTTQYRNKTYWLKASGYSSGTLVDSHQIRVTVNNTLGMGLGLLSLLILLVPMKIRRHR
ncbi:MAG: hypothetical protein HXS53_03270 [Theionarchaea archaeon]|nr:hypothetical protein [Theionarchaea archaeon]